MADYSVLKAKIDAAFSMVSDLCNRRREWVMSIPARPDHDPDLVIADGLQVGRDAIKRSEEVEGILRHELWLRHGHIGLYGDDGEMQCGACGLDFKRQPIEQIFARLQAQDIHRYDVIEWLKREVERWMNPWTYKILNQETGNWDNFCHDAPIPLKEAESRVEELQRENPNARFKVERWIEFNLQMKILNLEARQSELLDALRKIRCTDCKDGVLLADSLLFDLDREDEDQPCPNCAIRYAAILKGEGDLHSHNPRALD